MLDKITGTLILIQIIFIALKLLNIIAWSWAVVASPVFIFVTIGLALLVYAVVSLALGYK